MKNKLLYIVLLTMIIFPIGVDAASIRTASISSVTEQQVGTYFYVPFNIYFSGLGNDLGGKSGIYMVGLSIEVDESVLEITDMISDFYDSEIYKDGNTYYILSTADTDSTGNKCSDGFLACGDYAANIRFHLKSDSVDSTDIKLTEVAAGVFDLDNTLESYTVENMKELSFTNQVTRTIKIKKSEGNTVQNTEVPKSTVIEDSKPEIKTETIETSKENIKTSTSNKNSNNKSSNTNLKSLVIEGYEIDFKSDQIDYEITVDNDIDSLTITAETEDEKSTSQTIGDYPLEDEVKIIVSAENGDEKTYTIKINRTVDEDDVVSNKDSKTFEDYKPLIYVGGGILIFIILLILIITHHNNRKLDKMLKNL